MVVVGGRLSRLGSASRRPGAIPTLGAKNFERGTYPSQSQNQSDAAGHALAEFKSGHAKAGASPMVPC